MTLVCRLHIFRTDNKRLPISATVSYIHVLMGVY